MLFLAGLALIAFLVSAMGESRTQNISGDSESLVRYVTDQDTAILEGSAFGEGTVLQTDKDSEWDVFFKDSDLIRVYPDSELTVVAADFESMPMTFHLILSKGSIWLSDLQGVAQFTLDTNRMRIEPQKGSTFVRYDDGGVDIFAAHHPTRVSFLSDDEDKTVLNTYLLTESHQASVEEAGLSRSIDQLRYTKLTKEHPFAFVDEEQWEDDWESALDLDQDRLAEVYTDFVSALRRYGNGGHDEGSFSSRVRSVYRAVRSVFTFSKQHLLEIEEDEDLDLLYQALYLILDGDTMGSRERLSQFEAAANGFESLEKLNELTWVFQSVYYNDAFYPAKEAIWDIRKNATDSEDSLVLLLGFLREQLMEVYDLLDRGDISKARSALLAYSDAWQDLMIGAGSDLGAVVQGMTAERQILQNLLYRNDTFYDLDSYEVLSALEERILTLTAEEYDLNEERQAFVQDKIRVLTRLVELIDDELVGIDDGSDLAYQLIDEANDLLQDITVQTAVIDYFDEKLEELGKMMEFINSPDYELAQGTFEDKFDAYQNKEQEMDDLSDYILGITDGEEISGVSLEDAQAEAETAFRDQGITYTALVPLGDTNYRLFSVEGGRVDLIDFQASYDRITGIVYDLEVEGDIFSVGVRLEDLKAAVEEAVKDEVEDPDNLLPEDTGRQLTALESFAIGLVETTLVSAGFDVIEDQISVVDLDENLFQVELVILHSDGDIDVSFRYDADDEYATEVIGEVDGVLFAIGEAALSNLEDAVKEAWDNESAE